MVQGDPLRAADLPRLADLHAANLPTSIFVILGADVLQCYYRMVADSPIERVFLVRDEPTVVAAAVLSFDSDTLLGRFLRAHPASLGRACLRALRTQPPFRRQLLAYLRERTRECARAVGMPEIVQIYTHSAARGRGLGGRLLTDVEALLISRTPHRQYFIRTLAENNHATILFYRAHGFEVFDRVLSRGDVYLWMKRQLVEHRS